MNIENLIALLLAAAHVIVAYSLAFLFGVIITRLAFYWYERRQQANRLRWYQRETLKKARDGEYCFGIIPTGAGKSGSIK